ncbi:PREDICTED: putative E3 ubiquitin-protein ligase RING1a isoform X2 [Camelina sativa]|uniref:E3 ubiquitin-protein ligase RING1a isoform X2 n=1 Tax=Camelina sativa TaxID=90675 RepID=A0ABM0Y2G0_CAMSA|nr:PREDICTED: putative E3 ubiquitin-protein ligase RING1a isoform X2 [Camelina sativa]
MPVSNSFPSSEIPDEGDQQSDRFNPEAQQDLQDKKGDVNKDEEEVKRDEAEEEEEVEEVKPNEAEEEKDKEDDDGDEDDAEKEVEEEEVEEEEEEEEDEEEEEEDEEEDSKETGPSSLPGDQSEYMEIDLGEIRKDVQCPICLGIIRKTRTVMECLHRFCQECIDKSMRLGNNECPACRKHCASRRSLRDDPKFDSLIAALFTNIDSYEEEELAFHEDEKARNKQIQASIAQISQRQSEALVKRRSLGKEAAVLMRSPRIASGSRRRRNCRNMEQQNASEAHDDDNNDDINNNGGGKDSSSDERGTEVRQKKRRKRSTSRSTQHPSSSEILAWGRGGTRSNTRHGNNISGGSSKTARNARVNKLVEYLRSSIDGPNVEVDIHLKLVSMDTNCIPDLPQPYLCCKPALLVKQLRGFVALQMNLKTEEVELLITRRGAGEDATIEKLPVVTSASAAASKDEMQSLQDNETLSRLKVDFISSHEQHLIIAYRKKQTE